ncbi:hypothetical protein [Bifidobacterium magnum]|uniref:Putative phage protein gp45 n=1 Tax=Bifidobacterium magnum TaxID=1692 RepID=A0A087B671_9BIFI|nr:hypothetical protein [Bifidobacterium magnum]KFI66521.1 putative phage protein gp45 [Bifidobacterium magnum]
MSNTKITVDFSALSAMESRIVKKLAAQSDRAATKNKGVPPFVWNNGTTLNVEFFENIIVQAQTDQHDGVHGVMVNGSWETLLGSVKRPAQLRTDDIPAPVLEHVHTVHVKDATAMLNVLHTATVIARNDKHHSILQCVWLQGSKGSNKLTVGATDRFRATYREIDVEPLEADVHALISNSTLSGLLTKRRADAGSFDMDVVTNGKNNYVRFHCAPNILFYALGSDHEPPAIQRLFHRVEESNITITANVKDVVKALDIASHGAAKCENPAIVVEFDSKQNVMWFHGGDKDDAVAAVNAVVDVRGERYRIIHLNRKYFMDALKGVARGSETVVLSMLTPVKPVIICSAETVDDQFPFGTIICPIRGGVDCTNDWTSEYAQSATMIGSRDDVSARRETVKPVKKRKTVKRETVKVEPSTDLTLP